MLFATAALVLAAVAQAIQVTSPTNNTDVTAGQAVDITWDSVSTDPTSFEIVLQEPSTSTISTKTIADDVQTSAGTYSFTPDAGLSGGDYRISFMNKTTNAILAQSDYFTIKAGSGSVSSNTASTVSGASTATTNTGAAAITSGATSAASGSSTETAIPNASTSKASGAMGLAAPSLALVAGALVAFVL